MYKSFIRSHLDNVSFHLKFESIQYSAALVIIGTIRRATREKSHHELSFESLENRRWYHNFVSFVKFSGTISKIISNLWLEWFGDSLAWLWFIKKTIKLLSPSKRIVPSTCYTTILDFWLENKQLEAFVHYFSVSTLFLLFLLLQSRLFFSASPLKTNTPLFTSPSIIKDYY